uniref:Uncharacterized protein n=1 Tax=Salmonella sp. TaxID=599 RepID=A0A482ETL6_SALSP|nr:hypothetical protein NNIBIDOC_00242 [Salmonella sp.]
MTGNKQKCSIEFNGNNEWEPEGSPGFEGKKWIMERKQSDSLKLTRGRDDRMDQQTESTDDMRTKPDLWMILGDRTTISTGRIAQRFDVDFVLFTGELSAPV